MTSLCVHGSENAAPQTVYTENEARDLFVTLVSTISYVHSKNVVHRDLKVSE